MQLREMVSKSCRTALIRAVVREVGHRRPTVVMNCDGTQAQGTWLLCFRATETIPGSFPLQL